MIRAAPRDSPASLLLGIFPSLSWLLFLFLRLDVDAADSALDPLLFIPCMGLGCLYLGFWLGLEPPGTLALYTKWYVHARSTLRVFFWEEGPPKG